MPKKGKRSKILALAAISMLTITAVVVVIAMDQTAGPTGGYADTLGIDLTTYDPLAGAIVGSATVDVYVDGVDVATITTDGTTGIGLSTYEVSTGQKVVFIAYKSSYCYSRMDWEVPMNTKNLKTYWKVGQIDMFDADTSATTMVCDSKAEEKSTSAGSPWVASSTNDFKLYGYIKISASTDKSQVGNRYVDPSLGEDYPDQRTYMVLKMNQTVDGFSIVGWSLGSDRVTWYKELTPFQRNDEKGDLGTLFSSFTMKIPTGTTEFKITPYIWSNQDPAEMAISTPDTANKLFDITGTAQYLNATA